MSDERADLILNMLLAIRAEQAASVRNSTKSSSGSAGTSVRLPVCHSDYASLSVRLDNLDRRVGRIEQRLELTEVPTST